MAKKRGNQLYNAAIQDGLRHLVGQRPRLSGLEDYIAKHIDPAKLREVIGGINNHIRQQEKKGKQLSDEDKAKLIYENLANYVASGGVLDRAGQEVILKKSLEGKVSKSALRSLFSRESLDGDKYLDNVVGAFRDVYGLLKTGDYAQRMPELAYAVATIYDLGFLNAAVDVLAQQGLIDERRYRVIKKAVKEKTKVAASAATVAMEKYATQQQAQAKNQQQTQAKKIAASILAVLGAGLLVVSGVNITGNVIGSSFNNFSGMLTGLLFLFAAFLIFIKKK